MWTVLEWRRRAADYTQKADAARDLFLREHHLESARQCLEAAALLDDDLLALGPMPMGTPE